MACCGGGDDETKQEGVVIKRRCRDVLCLLIFIAFWAGMFIVCGMAVKQGDVGRLVYGTDAYGFTCGGETTFKNVTLDLKSNKNLYYLNPLDLLSVVNIPYAKTICSNGCPQQPNVCNYSSLPCTTGNLFRCPYYRFASNDLYGQLSGVADFDTQWFDALKTMNTTQDASASSYISMLKSANIGWINNLMSTYNITASTSVSGAYYQLRSQVPGNGPCYPVWVETEEYFYRCFPKIPSEWTDSVVEVAGSVTSAIGDDQLSAFSDYYNSVSEKWSRYVGDISKGILIIIVGGLVAGVVLSLLWMLILRYLAGFMAWMTILLVNVALVGITLYSFSFAGLLGDNALGQSVSDNLPNVVDPTSMERSTWKYIAIASAIVTGVVLLITLLMISRIRIAIACIKVASQAVGAMPSIVFFPLLPFVFEVGLVIYWIAITGLLYTAGDITANCRNANDFQPFSFKDLSSLSASSTVSSTSSSSNTTYSCYTNYTRDDMVSACAVDTNCYLSYDWNNQLKYAFIYHFFGLLWTNQFIVGFSCVTIAGAIASYYWSRGDSAKMPIFPVLSALKNTTIYHMGSVAFGAFIIAVIQFIRFLLEYLDRKTKELQANNKFAEWAMCCAKCCMWCLEKIVQYINRNAYIMIAVKGSNYCVSAGAAISLIIKNALRVAAVNVIGDVLIFLGKVAVAAGCGLAAFGMSELDYYNNATKYPDTFLSSPILPVALSILIGFVVAEVFFAVYEMAIDTVILAFCEDCDTNGGDPKYAPPLLMEAMGITENAQAVKPITK